MTTNPTADEAVVDDTAAHQYRISHDGRTAGIAVYRQADANRIVISHTEMEPEFEGQGLASRLARAVLDDIRARGLEVTPSCPFFASYIGRHRQYADLVDPEHRNLIRSPSGS